MSRLLLLLTVLLAATVSAEEKGYKIVRPDGTVEFSDKPQPGAVEIPLPRSQGYEPPPLPPVDAGSGASPATEQAFSYARLEITSPTAEQTYQAAEGPVHVQVQLEPPLRPGHTLVILLDGKPAGRGPSVALADLERGSHAVTAEVQDANGTVIKSSAAVTFFVKQYSSLFNKPAPSPAPKPAP